MWKVAFIDSFKLQIHSYKVNFLVNNNIHVAPTHNTQLANLAANVHHFQFTLSKFLNQPTKHTTQIHPFYKLINFPYFLPQNPSIFNLFWKPIFNSLSISKPRSEFEKYKNITFQENSVLPLDSSFFNFYWKPIIYLCLIS